MDYEKKYKEAIERMKSWARGEHPECFSEAQKAAEFVFPELAESNDEKIRKRLLTDFSMLGKEEWGGLKVKDICAWLEQQKEYVSADFDYVWERTDCESLTSSLDKYSEEAIKKVCHAWYDKGIELERKSWLEKQELSQSVTKKSEQDTWNDFDEKIYHVLYREFSDRAVSPSYDANLNAEVLCWADSVKKRLKRE